MNEENVIGYTHQFGKVCKIVGTVKGIEIQETHIESNTVDV